MFFDDGDLHDDDGDRNKKFRWQLNNDIEDFTNILSDSSEEDNSDDESGQYQIVRLKKEMSPIESEKKEIDDTIGSGKIYNKSAPTTSSTITRSAMIKKQNTKISSFFIKDERLKNILNKRPANFNDNFNKKLKNKESSIFDLINI